MKSAQVSREELYQLVWSKPMMHVASDYGISGNGLAKICRKMDVPCPPRGYWAKHAVGKAPKTPPLPKGKGGTPTTTTISATPAPAADEGARQAEMDLRAARERLGEINVPDRLVRPHSIVAAWLAKHQREKQEARQQRDPWRRDLFTPKELTESDHRRHRILNALFKVLEKQGGKVTESDRKELHYEQDGEKIEFQLRDKFKQVRRPLTDREKQWYFSDKDWRQELQPTGKLIFEFKTYFCRSLRRDWLETDTKPMEKMLPNIVATFAAAIPLLVEQRRQRQEAEQRSREAQQRRFEEEQRRKLDDARWRKFLEFGNAMREASLGRELLARLVAQEPDRSTTVGADTLGDWIEWAEEQIDAKDPLRRGAAELFGEVARVNQWTYRD